MPGFRVPNMHKIWGLLSGAEGVRVPEKTHGESKLTDRRRTA
jgi:hypothetical protein